MTAKVPHPHAEFLAEAALDISRKIRGKHIHGDFWAEADLSFVAASNQLWEFQFADTVENEVVSSLSNAELYAIFSKRNHDNEDVDLSILRLIANAAAAKHAGDIAKNLTNDNLKKILSGCPFSALDFPGAIE